MQLLNRIRIHTTRGLPLDSIYLLQIGLFYAGLTFLKLLTIIFNKRLK